MHFPHGETSCQEADGGTACFMFSFPRGVGFELDQPLLYNAMVNDVRVAGSPPMRFAFELAVELSRQPARQNVGLWYGAHESDANAFNMLLAGAQSFYTFAIPLDAESVSWAAFRSVASGRLLNVWHRERRGLRTCRRRRRPSDLATPRWACYLDWPSCSCGQDPAGVITPRTVVRASADAPRTPCARQTRT